MFGSHASMKRLLGSVYFYIRNVLTRTVIIKILIMSGLVGDHPSFINVCVGRSGKMTA